MGNSKKRDLMDTNPKTGSDKLPMLDDLFDMVKLNEDFQQFRFLNGWNSFAMFWIEIKTKEGNTVRIPRVSLNYNPSTDSFDDNGCPYQKAGLKPTIKYLFNVIDRDRQEDLGKKSPKYSKDELKAKHLIHKTKSKSPVRVICLPPTQVDKLKKLQKLNKVKDKKTKEVNSYSVTHEKHGMDVNISYDKDKKGGNQYDIQTADKNALEKFEQEYLVYDLDILDKAFKPMSLEEAKADMKALKKIMVAESGDDSDYDEDDSKKKKKKKGAYDSDDDSDNSDNSDNSDSSDDSDNDKKKKKGKDKKSKKKSNSSDDSDNSDSSDDSDNSDSSDNSDVGSDLDSSDNSDDSDSSDDSDNDKKKKKGKKSKKKNDSDDDSDNSDSSDDSDNSDTSDSSDSSDASDDSDDDKKKSKKKKSSKDKKKKRK